ncbi:MAG: hypothetical protein ACI4KF_02105 [Huintestinicola sp.]
MKLTKTMASVAVAAMAASMLSVSASATNWSAASYADEDPATVNIISCDENSVTFTATKDGTAAKCRITLDKVLANPDDAAKIKSMNWKVTYHVDTNAAPGNGLGGGTYAATTNSVSYWLSPDYDDDGNAYWANDTYELEDSVKYLLPSSVPSADGELVFMDWSNGNLVSDNVTITISDLKIFDADGNEIEQAPFGGSEEAAPAETEAAAEEAAPAETEAPAEEAAPAETAAPAADSTTTAATTGNTAAATLAAVMAVAGVAAVAFKKRA